MFKYKIEANELNKPVIIEAASSIEAVFVFMHFAKAFKEGMHSTSDEVRDENGDVTFMRMIFEHCDDSNVDPRYIDPRCDVYTLTRI